MEKVGEFLNIGRKNLLKKKIKLPNRYNWLNIEDFNHLKET